jgi:hypothetical protein
MSIIHSAALLLLKPEGMYTGLSGDLIKSYFGPFLVVLGDLAKRKLV